eukprot:scaffold7397_cov277-Pinguiococcus_pyrenoidosus.AAC.4
MAKQARRSRSHLHFRLSRQPRGDFHDSAREAELVPALEHARAKRLLQHLPPLLVRIEACPGRAVRGGQDLQLPFLRRRDMTGVVVLQGAAAAAAHVIVTVIKRRPDGVIAVLERALRRVELVAHDQFQGLPAHIALGGLVLGQRRGVHPASPGHRGQQEHDKC